MAQNKDQYFSKTLEKGLTILKLFDRDHSRRSLAEIAKVTGINKTSAYRFVNTLVELGYLTKSKRNKSLKLGPRAFVLGHNFVNSFDLLQGFKPVIDNTFMQHNITIDSALLYDQTLISIYRKEAPNIIYFRLPMIMSDLYARAMGKAVLAHFSDEDLTRFLAHIPRKRLTPHTVIDRDELVRELKLTRDRGYAVNNEEYVLGLICIGVPLMNYNTNTVAGAVSLDFPSSEYSLKTLERSYTGVLTKLASELSQIITAAEM